MKQKRKFTGKEKAVLAALLVAMIAVVAVGAFIIVNNVNEANRLATQPNTTVEITLPETTENNTSKDSKEKKAKDKKESKKKSSKTQSKKSSVSQSSNSSQSAASKAQSTVSKSKTTSSKSQTVSKSKSQSQSSNKVPVHTPTENKSHATKKILSVNGKECHVGDTITMTLNLKTPKVLVNYQGYTSFDESKLKFIESDSDSGALVNCKDGIIYYNASILSGIDFTSTGTVYYAKFKVLSEGSTNISNTFQVMTDMNDNAVSESDCSVGLEIFD